jgi:hypothetical protein
VRSFTRRARRPYRLGWFGVATGLFALAGTVIPVSMIIVILSIPGPLVQNVILVGVCLAFLWYAWRTALRGVWVTASGFTLVGLVRTRRLAWQDVESFEVGQVLPAGSASIVRGVALLRDGRRLVLPGLVGGKGAMPGVDSIAAAIAKLNVELRRWRTQG